MTAAAPRPVVIGVDGSASASAAVRLAAHEAARRGCPLRVVHAFIWPLLRVPLGPSPLGPPEGGLRAQADRIVADAITDAHAAAPDVPVTGEVVEGAPAAVLLRESRRAELVVIGSRGLGGFAGLVLGSVATQVAEYAHCPVLVARGEEHAGGPVVVGVDGSEHATLALDFAWEQAARRATDLVVVHAWRSPGLRVRATAPPPSPDRTAEAEGEKLLATLVADARRRHPEIPVTERLLPGPPAKALLAAAETAQLIVVGARGLGGFAGMLLGSVSQAVVRHAPCPVAIVRPRATASEPAES
ncbi:MAG TPA: universal stress protein [Micromonospora sp.]